MITVFLGGEGRNELGGWADPVSWREERPQRGVIEALLQERHPTGWVIRGGMPWKNIRKLKVGGRDPEARNLQGLHLAAREAGAAVMVCLRDQDRDPRRVEILRQAARELESLPGSLPFALGLPSPCLEGWLLAIAGERGTESLSNEAASGRMKTAGVSEKGTAAMVGWVEQHGLRKVAPCATALHDWLNATDLLLGDRG